MEIRVTLNTAKEMLFNDKFLALLVDDYEYGRAIASMDSLDEDGGYFKKSVEERAKIVAEHIQKITKFELERRIEKILKDEQESR